jgi:hypothetical protein
VRRFHTDVCRVARKCFPLPTSANYCSSSDSEAVDEDGLIDLASSSDEESPSGSGDSEADPAWAPDDGQKQPARGSSSCQTKHVMFDAHSSYPRPVSVEGPCAGPAASRQGKRPREQETALKNKKARKVDPIKENRGAQAAQVVQGKQAGQGTQPKGRRAAGAGKERTGKKVAEVIGEEDLFGCKSKQHQVSDDVMARIRKALALGLHPGGTEAEKTHAMRRATKLMQQYGLSQAGVGFRGSGKTARAANVQQTMSVASVQPRLLPACGGHRCSPKPSTSIHGHPGCSDASCMWSALILVWHITAVLLVSRNWVQRCSRPTSRTLRQPQG